MTARNISVSTVAYDGYPVDVAFAELEGLGLSLVEPAYIKGYMDFSEADFSDAAAVTLLRKMSRHSLRSIAISAHMDSGQADAIAMLARRIRFTAAIGARFTITNSTTRDRRVQLEKCIEANLPLAESLGVIIALENPGNGVTNLMRDGATGSELVKAFNSSQLKLNYDTANALTCTEGEVQPESDIDFALPVSCHMHLKDVVRRDGNWRYVGIGSGELDYKVILDKLRNRPDIPLTLELPLRLNRRFHHDPQRDDHVPELEFIRSTIQSSWNFVADTFGNITRI